MQDSEGLQVDHDAGGGTKAPEVIAAYNQSSPAPYYVPIDQQHQHQQKPSGPFGLSLWLFTIIVVAITAAIVGGGVGGGLGAALSNCQNSDSKCSAEAVGSDESSTTANPTPSATTSAAFFTPTPASQIRNLTWFCEEAEQTKTIQLTSGFEFKVYCGTDGGGANSAEGGGALKDLVGIIAYSLEDCLQACTQMNAMDDNQDTGVTCKSVSFRANIAQSYKQYGGNCWLKDAKKGRPFSYNAVWNDIPFVAYGELL
ncbi:hypothetical protein MRS44_011198 [Fusarium solani]|uniref:Apple domain-containing protein n=1 Tax=Fusarium solani TaxID=169388 RepID=A0A9P9KUC2_FUSSL|nr:uncharacterized protein B0J15DRAFT_592080 [Fusarium solani]KAH7268535.1 hypothetical protein B0J15DRAFT_592080 [Fusarium solani]KAJ3460331.1 hypothetical protein MRS44_011198 [Fusarium solani]